MRALEALWGVKSVYDGSSMLNRKNEVRTLWGSGVRKPRSGGARSRP